MVSKRIVLRISGRDSHQKSVGVRRPSREREIEREMALLGDDGRGFELARKLESCGVWRSWFGDSLYSNFIQYLSSPTTWESFMKSDDSKSKAQIQLQLRARALLFDKACVSLFLRSPSAPAFSLPVSKLNPSYLQLHGDDVYFTLEQDGVPQREGVTVSNAAPSKVW